MCGGVWYVGYEKDGYECTAGYGTEEFSLSVEASPAFYSNIKALLGPGCLRR